jgi:putative ATP-binding cassette transporter
VNAATVSIISISIFLFIASLFFLVKGIKEIIQGKRSFVGFTLKRFGGLVISAVLFLAVMYCIYHIPDILLAVGTWSFLVVEGPISIIYAGLALAIVIPVFYLYLVFSMFFVNPDEIPYFNLAGLSAVSGLGNSVIIMTINTAVNRDDRVESGLIIYIIVGLAVFAVCSMISRNQLVVYTNQLVFDKRMEITDKILHMPYEDFEAMEEGNIQAALNNDTETISSSVNIIISGLTSVISLICCFIYLGNLNMYGLVFSIVAISVAASAFYFVSMTVNKVWERTRDIQNSFFKYIDDLISGFKELYLNKRKKSAFREDMKDTCENYKTSRSYGDIKFVGVTVMGELLYTSIIGIVVFIFPLLFSDVDNATLASYVLIYLYMSGAVNVILNAIPNIVRIKISWKRVNKILAGFSYKSEEESASTNIHSTQKIELDVKDIVYEYRSEEDDSSAFSVGPVNCSFKTGEVTFIAGGNGSGKSTLAKLITGLYRPQSGSITFNGNKVEPSELGKYSYAIFSDFHLFDKLYGIDSDGRSDEIKDQLKKLHMQDKVEIIDGAFSTTKLSTGQRKRLALMLCYLEDKPICIFDEWAADQDPEFRELFYKKILNELKNKGKCIIAITHDDRYFNLADKIIRMERGQVTAYEQQHSTVQHELVNA